jgi:hypothetical protein
VPGDITEKRERPALTVHAVLARGESDMAITAVAIPDREAQELETSQRAADEMELRISEFGGRGVVVAQEYSNDHGVGARCRRSPSASSRETVMSWVPSWFSGPPRHGHVFRTLRLVA